VIQKVSNAKRTGPPSRYAPVAATLFAGPKKKRLMWIYFFLTPLIKSVNIRFEGLRLFVSFWSKVSMTAPFCAIASKAITASPKSKIGLGQHTNTALKFSSCTSPFL
jgi:hypothetical protein